jgi:hypothetical protein
MTSFNIEDYKQMVEVLKGERDYEHNRFLDEQIKRSDLQEEIEELKQFNEWNKTATLKWNDELQKNKILEEELEKWKENAHWAKSKMVEKSVFAESNADMLETAWKEIKKLKEENEHKYSKSEYDQKVAEKQNYKDEVFDLREKNKILKSQFNNLINLIKTADTKNKIDLLKQLDTLDD